MTAKKTIDLTPSPRILKMLGQVEFQPWQCLAELIDNSIDAFLSSKSDGLGYMFPQVTVELPDNASIDSGSGQIKVVDNGPGMSPDDLEKAVQAGYSSNNSVDKLGLFGMGFNVATARMGARTEVWTTRPDDNSWWGVAIDFDEIVRGGFIVPALTKRKTPAEEHRHGTEVTVTKLDTGRAKYLRTGAGVRATRNRLSRVYDQIMRENGLVIVISGQQLEPRGFCAWDKKRYVDTSTWAGRVPAIIPIDENFGESLYCEECWAWLESDEKTCPSCGSADSLQSRSRKLEGWIGIQRYFDQKDFGFNLVRNGRIIEERTKSFFSWESPEGDIIEEYPIDTKHWGGRIIGELTMNFVPLASHQKDSFDHNSREWDLVKNTIHGEGPILQEVRKQIGYSAANESPLARLHTGYRRGAPAGLRRLVPGDATTGKGLNSEAQQWASLFYAGDERYKDDEIWWKAVVAGEDAKNAGKGSKVPDDLAGGDLLPGSEDTQTDDKGEQGGGQIVIIHDELDPALSGDFIIDDIPSCPTLSVETRKLISGSLSSGLHMEFAAAGNRVVVTYDPNHALFTDTLIDPVDCLAEELAYQFLARAHVVQADWGISRIGNALKRKYFTWAIDSFESAESRADSFTTDFRQALVDSFSGGNPVEQGALSPDLVEEILHGVSRKTHGGRDETDRVIVSGEFPRFVSDESLLLLLELFPERLTDGNFFSMSYSGLPDELKTEVVTEARRAFSDVVELASGDLDNVGTRERKARLARGLGSLNLLEAWRL